MAMLIFLLWYLHNFGERERYIILLWKLSIKMMLSLFIAVSQFSESTKIQGTRKIMWWQHSRQGGIVEGDGRDTHHLNYSRWLISFPFIFSKKYNGNIYIKIRFYYHTRTEKHESYNNLIDLRYGMSF